jgi:hypothetical protein
MHTSAEHVRFQEETAPRAFLNKYVHSHLVLNILWLLSIAGRVAGGLIAIVTAVSLAIVFVSGDELAPLPVIFAVSIAVTAGSSLLARRTAPYAVASRTACSCANLNTEPVR